MRFFSPPSPHYSGNRRSYGNFQPDDELMVRELKPRGEKKKDMEVEYGMSSDLCALTQGNAKCYQAHKETTVQIE